jgi:hypothetical protein
MKTRRIGGRRGLGILGGVLIVGTVLGSACSLSPRKEAEGPPNVGRAAEQSSPSNWTMKDIEAFLTKARITVVEKDVESGRTMPWRVTLDDGQNKARGIFKYINRPGVPPLRHSYRYELAAYSLNRFLELEIVPPVVEREIEGTAGALQWYLENCLSEQDRERLKKEPPDLRAFLRRLDVVQVFEALVNDECGDKSDTLIHLDTWKICRIDFSGAFLPTRAIAPACSLQHCSRDLFNRLIRLTRPTLVDRLSEYLSPEEIDALFERNLKIVDHFKSLIMDKGEAAVLFSEKRP